MIQPPRLDVARTVPAASPAKTGDSPRAARRLKVFQPASLSARGQTGRVHILNLSASGALIHGLAIPPVGAMVVLRMAEVDRPATVVWLDGRQGGLRFREPLTPAELDHAVQFRS